MKTKTVKTKKCVVCQTPFVARNSLHKVCSVPCALAWQKTQQEKRRVRELKAEKARVKQMRHALETLPELTRKAQAAFNAFIRARDRGKPCISCGAPFRDGFGGAFDAGHYRSTGAAAHLRFDEDNCHGQCVKCNRHLSGNAVAYRAGLLARIGQAAVERLESDNAPRKWDKDELREIATRYRRKKRELEKAA